MCRECDDGRELVYSGTWLEVAEKTGVLMMAGVEAREMSTRRLGKAWWGLCVRPDAVDLAYEALGLVRREA